MFGRVLVAAHVRGQSYGFFQTAAKPQGVVMSPFLQTLLSVLGALPDEHPVIQAASTAAVNAGLLPAPAAPLPAPPAPAPLVLDGKPSEAATVEAQVEGVIDTLLPLVPNPVPGLPPGILLGTEKAVLHGFGVAIVKLIEARAAK